MKRILVSVACSLAALPLAAAPAAASGAAAAKQAKIVDQVFAKFDSDSAPGCSVGVFQDGKTVVQRNYGVADVATRAPLTGDTVFYMASVSKQFTSLAAATLVEAGKLRLDDDIRRWIPELPDYGTPITVSMLMHHTSGAREVLGLFALSGTEAYETLTIPQVLRMMVRQKELNFTPGSQYSYTNGGYFLLAQVVARASGMPFHEYARKHILEPTGMSNSYFRPDAAPAGAKVAHGYVRDKASGAYSVRDTYPAFSGSGGLMSTVNDFARYDYDFHIGHKVWTDRVREIMLTPGRLNDGKLIDAGQGLSYAAGLRVGKLRGQPWVEHSGGHAAFTTNYSIQPKLRSGVVALCNRADDSPAIYTLRTAEQLFPKAFSGPAVSKERPERPKEETQPVPVALATALGVKSALYRSEELDADYLFEPDGDALQVRVFSGFAIGEPMERLGRFRLQAADVLRGESGTLRLERGAGDKITGFVLSMGRLEGGVKFTRIN